MPISFDEGQEPLQPTFPFGPPERTALTPVPPRPPIGEIAGAAFGLDNKIGSLARAIGGPSMEIDPNHNPIEMLREAGRDNEDLTPYLDSPNEGYTRWLMARKDQEDHAREVLAQSGWAGTAMSIFAGLADPINFIPLAGIVRGARLVENVARTAALGAGFTAGHEAALQATQVSRTWEESAGNIAAGTVFAGILGVAASALTAKEFATATKLFDQARPRVDVETGKVVPHEVGATATDTRELVPQLQAITKANIGTFNPLVLSPNQRIYFNGSEPAKRAARDIAETAIKFKPEDQVAPFGEPLESQKRVIVNTMAIDARDIMREGWARHYHGEEGPSKIKMALGTEFSKFAPTTGEKLSFDDFNKEVYRAGINLDEHPRADVAKVAKELRARIWEPLKEMGKDTKFADGTPLIDEAMGAPAGAQSFMPKLVKREEIAAQRPTYKKDITNWLIVEQEHNTGVQERLRALVARQEKNTGKIAAVPGEDVSSGGLAKVAALRTEQQAIGDELRAVASGWRGDAAKVFRGAKTPTPEQVDEAVGRMLKVTTDRSPQELASRADEWINREIGQPGGRLPYDEDYGGPRIGYSGSEKQELRGSLRERRVAFPVERMLDTGLIHHDIQHNVESSLNTLVPDILLIRRFGDVDATDALKKINAHYDARATVPGKVSSDVEAARKADLRDVAALRDRLRGVYGTDISPESRKYVAAMRDIGNVATVSQLGSATLASVVDLGLNALFRHGLLNTMKDVYIPFIKALSGVDPSILKMSRAQAREMGIGVETALGTVRHRLDDVLSGMAPENRFSKGLAWSTSKFFTVNLLGPWTDLVKGLQWNLVQAEFGRVAKRIADGTAKKADIAKMADANISPAMAAKISAEYEAHHIVKNGAKFANMEEWTDAEAKRVFQSALSKEIETLVITPGIGDRPLWMSNPAWRWLGLFRSFTAAAHEKMVLGNLSFHDAYILSGLVGVVGLGSLSYALYQLSKGEPMSKNPADLVKESIDRSNLTGWLNEPLRIVSKQTGGKFDINRLYGATAPLSRYRSSSILGDVGGPIVRMAENVGLSAGHVVSGEATGTDVHKLSMILPYRNLFYFRKLFDEVEEGLSRSLNLKPRATPVQ